MDGDNALEFKLLSALRAHKKGCDNDTFRAFFSLGEFWDFKQRCSRNFYRLISF